MSGREDSSGGTAGKSSFTALTRIGSVSEILGLIGLACCFISGGLGIMLTAMGVGPGVIWLWLGWAAAAYACWNCWRLSRPLRRKAILGQTMSYEEVFVRLRRMLLGVVLSMGFVLLSALGAAVVGVL